MSCPAGWYLQKEVGCLPMQCPPGWTPTVNGCIGSVQVAPQQMLGPTGGGAPLCPWWQTPTFDRQGNVHCKNTPAHAPKQKAPRHRMHGFGGLGELPAGAVVLGITALILFLGRKKR